MSTISTGMNQDTLEELAAAQSEAVSGAEVSEDVLTEAEPVQAADHRQLRQLAKLQETTVDRSIFETTAEGTSEKIRYTTTFDEVLLFNSINSSSESVSDHFDEDITVENIVITTAQVHIDIDDDLSDREDKPCVHFFCKDGLHIASVSNGIIRSAENLITCAIIPSPEAPIVIRFKEIKTKRGKAHSFDLISR